MWILFASFQQEESCTCILHKIFFISGMLQCNFMHLMHFQESVLCTSGSALLRTSGIALLCTSNSALLCTPTWFTYLQPHLQCTPTSALLRTPSCTLLRTSNNALLRTFNSAILCTQTSFTYSHCTFMHFQCTSSAVLDTRHYTDRIK